VIQVGFDESWRWRMAGAPGAETAHRDWWSRIVGSVAYAPVIEKAGRQTSSHPERSERVPASVGAAVAAPLSYLIDQLGPPRAAPADVERWSPDSRILLAVMLVLLLVEWTSRRLKGAR
jgi:hypothetical protein